MNNYAADVLASLARQRSFSPSNYRDYVRPVNHVLQQQHVGDAAPLGQRTFVFSSKAPKMDEQEPDLLVLHERTLRKSFEDAYETNPVLVPDVLKAASGSVPAESQIVGPSAVNKKFAILDEFTDCSLDSPNYLDTTYLLIDFCTCDSNQLRHLDFTIIFRTFQSRTTASSTSSSPFICDKCKRKFGQA